MTSSLINQLENEIHIHTFEFKNQSDLDINFLTQDEQKRAIAFKKDMLQQQFIFFHIEMRRTLSRYLNCDILDIEYQKLEHGKPQLVLNSSQKLYLNSKELHFNLSHTKNYATLAIGLQPLGIDLEQNRKKNDILGIAKRFFAPDEYLTLQKLHESNVDLEKVRERFIAIWVRKEAFVKAHGGGIASGLNNFIVSLDDFGQSGKLKFWSKGEKDEWSFSDLNLFADIYSAVCYKTLENSSKIKIKILNL